MRLLKETIELRADSDFEAKELIENYRKEASEKDILLVRPAIHIKLKSLKA